MGSLPANAMAYPVRPAGNGNATRNRKMTLLTRTLRLSPASSQASDPASLLAQLGAHAAARFARQLAPLELHPAHAGIFKVLASSPGISQRALCRSLGIQPSRMVAYVDDLETKGLLERRLHQSDRRNHALYLTKAGHAAHQSISRLEHEHQHALFSALSRQQRTQLTELLELIASQQGLGSGPPSA